MAEEKKERINMTNAALMISAALIFDVISVIPAVGQLIADVLSVITFLIWFLILGLPLISPKKITTYAVSFVISVVPILSILPEITVAIIAFILITRAEDALGVQVLSRKGLKNPAAIAGELKPQFNKLYHESPALPTAMKYGPRIKEVQERTRRQMDDILPRNSARRTSREASDPYRNTDNQLQDSSIPGYDAPAVS